jgi:adenosylmethionine-8-amino-7-oxononanoate aminotransferase
MSLRKGNSDRKFGCLRQNKSVKENAEMAQSKSLEENNYVFDRAPAGGLPLIERGEGIYLFDSFGKRYIDGSSGALISNIGHAIQVVTEALIEQMRKVEFVHGTQFTSESIKGLAKKIARMAPGKLNKVYFVSGGSEAIETAIKMARGYHVIRGNVQKYKIISRWHSYHGATLGALSLSGRPALRKLYAPMLLDFPHIVPAYCYRCPYNKDNESCQIDCAKDLERVVTLEGPEYIAAFIAEPVVGATIGAVPAPEGYFKMIREICDRYDILFIADEVMTSFGRTGKSFGMDHWEVVPDLLVGSKGLGAGYFPIGIVIASEEVYNTYKDGPGKFNHGFTYQGNPLAGAVGLSVLDFIEKNNLIRHVEETGKYLIEGLSQFKNYRMVGNVRGKGFMTAFELVRDKETKAAFDPSLNVNSKIINKAFSNGLILYPSGNTGNVDGVSGNAVLVAPPLITTREQITEILNILEETLKEVDKELFD